MKLLLDQNLSPRLVAPLAELFPGTTHVRDAGLERASDRSVWEYARLHHYCILSKDADFHQLSFLYGAPPKVIWVQRGNCSTDDVASLVRTHAPELRAFDDDPDVAFLALR